MYLIQELLSIRETYQRPLCCGADNKNQEEDEEEEEDDEDINLGQAGEAERWINCQINKMKPTKNKSEYSENLKAKQTTKAQS